MAVTFNSELLDRFLAPGISVFTVCDAPSIEEMHPESSHWLTNHFLNSILRSHYKNRYRQYAINQLFRAQTAFREYHEARALTNEYLASGNPGSPATRAYFKAIARWESCFLNIQMFIDVMNKMKKDLKDEPVFKDGDGTPEQRAYALANTIKHWGADVAADRHSEDDTIPVWLTNTGFASRLSSLTYTELATLVGQLATAANELQDPLSFVGQK